MKTHSKGWVFLQSVLLAARLYRACNPREHKRVQ
jgi:hypothetical protein